MKKDIYVMKKDKDGNNIFIFFVTIQYESQKRTKDERFK